MKSLYSLLAPLVLVSLAGCQSVPEAITAPASERIPYVYAAFDKVVLPPTSAVFPPVKQHVWGIDSLKGDAVVVRVRLGQAPAKLRVPMPSPTRPGVPSAAPAAVSDESALVVHFAFDRADLDAGAKKQLSSFVKSLPPGSHDLLVDGYADALGADQYNDALSRRRATVVRDYLVSQGLGRKSITVRGHGERDPVATNNTESGRAENRRATVQERN